MSNNDQGTSPEKSAGFVRRVWTALWRPTSAYSLGALLIIGGLAGIIFWGGFNWAMEATNSEAFCISCHEMEENVYVEYKETVHYNNRSGVRATCPDCHVPKEWFHKVKRKIIASNELFHHFAGSVSTPEKFNAKRLKLAANVWKEMKATDSRECRNCHDFESMDFTRQETRSGKAHQEAIDGGKTCIDCHQGIAHTLPQGSEDAYMKLQAGMPNDQVPGHAQKTATLQALRTYVSSLSD